jgi:hypothetical protein
MSFIEVVGAVIAGLLAWTFGPVIIGAAVVGVLCACVWIGEQATAWRRKQIAEHYKDEA